MYSTDSCWPVSKLRAPSKKRQLNVKFRVGGESLERKMLGVQGQRFCHLSVAQPPANLAWGTAPSPHVFPSILHGLRRSRWTWLAYPQFYDMVQLMSITKIAKRPSSYCSFQSPPSSSEWWEQQRSLKLGCLLSPKNIFSDLCKSTWLKLIDIAMTMFYCVKEENTEQPTWIQGPYIKLKSSILIWFLRCSLASSLWSSYHWIH